MKLKFVAAAMLAASLTIGSPVLAGKVPRTFVVMNDEVGVPVFPYDFPERPYDIVGEIEAGVRKATLFSKEPSQEKIYKELWERADKLGADAVINARYGDSHMTAMSWGKTNATGTAIKFRAATVPEAAVPAATAAQ